MDVGWTKEEALHVLECGDWLEISHPDFEQTLEVRSLRGEDFLAHYEGVDDVAGAFAWGTFTVTGFCVIPLEYKHKEDTPIVN